MCFTWLEGHLTEQHPHIIEVETTLDSLGCAIPEGHGDKSGPLAHSVRRGPEGDGAGLPLRIRPEETRDLPEHPHSTAEHVAAVDLEGRETELNPNTWICLVFWGFYQKMLQLFLALVF